MPKIFHTILVLSLLPTQILFGKPAKAFTPADTLIYLPLPERGQNAMTGTAFVRQVSGWSIEEREKAVAREILAGNVPSFSRKLRPIQVRQAANGKTYDLVFYTVCDYMAIGSDEDFLYIPMTPSTAQYLADRLHCSLPTKKMVDIIYNHAEVRLRPQPIPPSDQMTTVPVFLQHTDSIRQQLAALGVDRSANAIIAGHKKDIILSNKIYSPDRSYDRVVIYGWHRSENHPIQPVYNGHHAKYADYSHGVRLIANTVILNGDSTHIDSILTSPGLAALLSDEGAISKPYYPPSDILSAIGWHGQRSPVEFHLGQNYPNPFNATTIIHYQLNQPLAVDLSIFNRIGEKVATLVSQQQAAGSYQVKWNAISHASGLYLYQLKAGSRVQSRSMILLK